MGNLELMSGPGVQAAPGAGTFSLALPAAGLGSL